MNTRVLVVAPRFPLPLRSGTQIRTYQMLRALADRFDVTLVALTQNGEGTDRVSQLESEGVVVETVPHSRTRAESLRRFVTSRQPYRVCKFATEAFREAIRNVYKRSAFDLVWVNFVQTLDALPVVDVPIIVDEHNSDTRYWQSFLDGSHLESLFARINIRRIQHYRSRIADRTALLLSVSESDAADARSWIGGVPVEVVPNGVDTERFSPSKSVAETGPRILFVGSLDVTMNTDAVRWFCESAYPRIRSACPEATVDIVGRNPTQEITQLADQSGVTVHADVPEVVPYYDRSSVFIAPFEFGGGSKLKILEALAMRRAVVSTPTGVVGLDIEDGEQLLVRDGGDEFVEAVIELLSDPKSRERLGKAGREYVEGQYSWETVTETGLDAVEKHVLTKENS